MLGIARGNVASVGIEALPKLCFIVAVAAASTARAETPVSFSEKIQPILETSCWQCHGESVRLSKLDLRTRESALAGGTRGRSISPGDANASRLYRMVSGTEKPAMPLGGKLTGEQIETIKLWIEQGAQWGPASESTAIKPKAPALADDSIPAAARNYWAFQKPVHPSPPIPNLHPIDAFIAKTLEQRGLLPGPPAGRATLVRRAYLDLLGLPPTPAEVNDFVGDQSPKAWEKLIDRLLASPQYGEKWGRHWLDVARYADSNGFEHDFDRPNAWRYRDYVIQSFNRDKPYDVFLREQIAGDEFARVTNETLIATGFLRNYAKVGFREKDNPEFRYEYLDDMIATIGRGVLGLTVQCARCHNHKFDPILQKDYYKLQASLFGYVEVDHPLTSPAEAAAYQSKLADVASRLADVRMKIATIEQPYRKVLLAEKYKRFPQNIQNAIATPEAQRTPGQVLLANQVIRTVSVSGADVDRVMKADDLQRKQLLTDASREIEKDRPAPIPVAMGITDGDYRYTPDGPGDEPAPGKGIKQQAVGGSFLHRGPEPYATPPSYLLIRGDVNSRGPQMEPGFVTVIAKADQPVALPPADGRTSGRRLALAEWLTSPDNPLPARVAVNRIWSHHFGRGIVATLDNFGKMGEPPTHPELLDWLATEFVSRGWSVKQMHRLIMTSEAYRRSSQFSVPANLERDADNRYLWRFPMQRLEAETIRDSILTVSGALNREVGGPPVFPTLQPEVLEQMKLGIWRNEKDGPTVWRRSVYIYRKRGLPFPMLEAFDLPDQNFSCGARAVSTVPTQALLMLNNEFVIRQAQLFAQRVREAAPGDRGRQVDLAYRLALGRSPDARETKLAFEYLDTHNLDGLAHVLMNTNEFVYLR